MSADRNDQGSEDGPNHDDCEVNYWLLQKNVIGQALPKESAEELITAKIEEIKRDPNPDQPK